jgi:hypothetical protein
MYYVYVCFTVSSLEQEIFRLADFGYTSQLGAYCQTYFSNGIANNNMSDLTKGPPQISEKISKMSGFLITYSLIKLGWNIRWSTSIFHKT